MVFKITNNSSETIPLGDTSLAPGEEILVETPAGNPAVRLLSLREGVTVKTPHPRDDRGKELLVVNL